MDIHLNFEFNDVSVSGFVIKNPQIIPETGTLVDFVWEDYINDPEHLKSILSEEKDFIAEVLNIKYSNNGTHILVILHDAVDFEKNMKMLYGRVPRKRPGVQFL